MNEQIKNEIEKVIKRIEAETEYTATATDDGLFIDHKKGDHVNDYDLTLEEDGKISVSNTASTEYFDTIEEAGDYLIEQLNFFN